MNKNLKRLIRRNVFLYFGLFGWRKNVRRLRAYPGYKLVVEAFPRSANTSSIYALLFAQKEELKVGHHLHAPAHLKYAVSREIPGIVILRKPIDCVASLMLMQKISNPKESKELLKDYIEFYRVAKNLADSLVIVLFDDVTEKGFGFAVARINQKYALTLEAPTGSEIESRWVRKKIQEWNAINRGGDSDKVSLPSEEKEKKLLSIRKQIAEDATLELERANALYKELHGLSTRA